MHPVLIHATSNLTSLPTSLIEWQEPPGNLLRLFSSAGQKGHLRSLDRTEWGSEQVIWFSLKPVLLERKPRHTGWKRLRRSYPGYPEDFFNSPSPCLWPFFFFFFFPLPWCLVFHSFSLLLLLSQSCARYL